MANFIRAMNGNLINIDHAVYAERRGEDTWILTAIDERSLGKVSEYAFSTYIGTVAVVPAAPGATAVVVHIDENDKPYVVRYPIVAWRVTYGGGAEPVLPEETEDTVLVEMPDGQLLSPFYALFQNLDQAVERLTAEVLLRKGKLVVSTSEVL